MAFKYDFKYSGTVIKLIFTTIIGNIVGTRLVFNFQGPHNLSI